MTLMSTCLFAFLSRDWQLYSAGLWGRLRWHNEHPYPYFLHIWPTLGSLLGREEYNNCCVIDHPPPPPPPAEGGEYTYQISPGVTEEGLCCHLLGCCTWKRTPELFVPAPGTLFPTADSKRIPQRWISFFLPFIFFFFKQCHSWRMSKICWFDRVLQSCKAAFYVQ